MGVLKSFRLVGKVVCITGASGQLGKALVKAFKEARATVIPTDLNTPLPLDVTNNESIIKARDAILEKYGRIDILVNNAGVAVFTPFEKRTTTEFYKVIDVNAKGTLFCCQIFAEKMKSGCIINIASIYGVVVPDHRIYGNSGRNSSEVYGMSKAGIIQLTKGLAEYLAPRIRVNCISPGGIFNNQDPEFVKNYCAKVPLGRMATEKDIVGTAVFLASDLCPYTTGQNFIIDGGLSVC